MAPISESTPSTLQHGSTALLSLRQPAVVRSALPSPLSSHTPTLQLQRLLLMDLRPTRVLSRLPSAKLPPSWATPSLSTLLGPQPQQLLSTRLLLQPHLAQRVVPARGWYLVSQPCLRWLSPSRRKLYTKSQHPIKLNLHVLMRLRQTGRLSDSCGWTERASISGLIALQSCDQSHNHTCRSCCATSCLRIK